jgi:hypothetical protein
VAGLGPGRRYSYSVSRSSTRVDIPSLTVDSSAWRGGSLDWPSLVPSFAPGCVDIVHRRHHCGGRLDCTGHVRVCAAGGVAEERVYPRYGPSLLVITQGAQDRPQTTFSSCYRTTTNDTRKPWRWAKQLFRRSLLTWCRVLRYALSSAILKFSRTAMSRRLESAAYVPRSRHPYIVTHAPLR